jgi:hypothetical protein
LLLGQSQIDAIPRPNSELRDEHSLNLSKKPRASVPPGAVVRRAWGAQNQPAVWAELDLALMIVRRGYSSFGVFDRITGPSFLPGPAISALRNYLRASSFE